MPLAAPQLVEYPPRPRLQQEASELVLEAVPANNLIFEAVSANNLILEAASASPELDVPVLALSSCA
ncbi:hypothetical protein CFC21_065984 [Triticum aestivum]|uniref:Uncharacterized protein n=4 Tax=Triticum TaxID=4564 RepID=A0A9R0WNB6_TRITD|nr:hypothetical protein TRIUR3_04554 [Triticum urartu]KAF7059031.1 hypothetical protein CFC21_065984 [Triticum aestivum]VAI17999.1 unnamed protein product [Triticum turgidum subsp. durum]